MDQRIRDIRPKFIATGIDAEKRGPKALSKSYSYFQAAPQENPVGRDAVPAKRRGAASAAFFFSCASPMISPAIAAKASSRSDLCLIPVTALVCCDLSVSSLIDNRPSSGAISFQV